MGFIYLIESPSGKCYVGQTVKENEAIRWSEHVAESKGNRDYSWKLNRAIRKYGPDAFKRSVLTRCPDEELDDWEEFFISLFDSFGPNGYNLTKGGANGFKYTPDVRAKMSASQRKNLCEGKELPPYVYLIKREGKELGFTVRPPGKVSRSFYKGTMDECFKLAQDALAEKPWDDWPDAKPKIREYKRNPERNRHHGKPKMHPESQGLPMYVTYVSTLKSYRVQKPNQPKKTFGNQGVPLETRKQQAIDYFNSLA